jgi:hypothetical protein
MSEFAPVVAGQGALAATGGFAARLRLRSPLQFLLAAYVVGRSWLVAVSLALSLARVLTRWSLLTSLACGVAVFVGGLNASVLLAPPAWDAGERAFYKAGLVLGTSGDVLADMFLALNARADGGFAWDGPLGALLLVAVGAVVVLARCRDALLLALAATPWVLLERRLATDACLENEVLASKTGAP